MQSAQIQRDVAKQELKQIRQMAADLARREAEINHQIIIADICGEIDSDDLDTLRSRFCEMDKLILKMRAAVEKLKASNV
jgi:hypothetical protein